METLKETGAGHVEGNLLGANLQAGDKPEQVVKPQKASTKGGNGRGNGGVQEEKERESPEDFRARKDQERKERLDAKIERAKKPETMLITRNAMDTNDLVFLINAFDFQFRGMRDRVGIKGSNVTLDIFQAQIDKTNALKDQIHLHNKELSAITGLKYRAPRGFK
jgi:hypothetical protein